MIAGHQMIYISVIKWLSILHISQEAHGQQLTLLLFMQHLASHCFSYLKCNKVLQWIQKITLSCTIEQIHYLLETNKLHKIAIMRYKDVFLSRKGEAVFSPAAQHAAICKRWFANRLQGADSFLIKNLDIFLSLSVSLYLCVFFLLSPHAFSFSFNFLFLSYALSLSFLKPSFNLPP